MMKNYILLLFLIILLPIVFFPNLLSQKQISESFTQKQPIITILQQKDKKYSFNYDNNEIFIEENDKKFRYSSSPNKAITAGYKLAEVSDMKFNLGIPKNNYYINISFSKKPVTVVVNDYELTIGVEKNDKNYKLILHGKEVGNIKIIMENNKTKSITIITNRPEINTLPMLTSIFTGFLLFDQINKLNDIDYNVVFS